MLVSASVGSLGLVLLSVYVSRVHEQANGGPPVELLALRRDATVGEPITDDMLMVRTLPAAFLEDRHVLASDVEQVLGVRVGTPTMATQTLLWTDLATSSREGSSLAGRIPEGMRAIGVSRSDQNGFGGLLRPGDRVDVLLTRSALSEHARVITVPLLQNLLVLSVGQSVEPSSDFAPVGRPNDVSLLVSIDQAALLTQAQHGGSLRLVLRNENDLEIDLDLREVDDRDVFDQSEVAQRARPFVLERVD